MSGSWGHEQLSAGYEALRAQAVGQLPTETPRGLALLLTQGLPAWMRAWAPLAEMPRPAAPAEGRTVSPALGSEVVRLLAEMALGRQARLAAP